MDSAEDRAGIYIHIPFCAGKCPYCDFYSLSGTRLRKAYIGALEDEIRTRRSLGFPAPGQAVPVDTVYFGGGTPSVLDGGDIARILGCVGDSFELSPDSEITVECNPSSGGLDAFLRKCAGAGVNRVSIGMQSAVSGERRALGRRGDAGRVEAAVKAAREAGIGNISLDIMLGIPESTLESLKQTLDFALYLGVPHLSAYMLKLEPGTRFYARADSLGLPDEDTVCDMYLFACGYLKENGFRHYEISNFCRGNAFSRHNMKYWTNAPYFGFGPAAHSFYRGKRVFFPRDINAFIEGRGAEPEGEGGTGEETVMLALRTDLGLKVGEHTDEFRKKAAFFAENGFARLENDVLTLTDKGFLVSNSIITELLLADEANGR